MSRVSAERVKMLVKKDLLLEFRSKAAIGELLVYVVSTVFVCYRAFNTINSVPVWNALFWIIILFSSINAVSRSFYRESRAKRIYYYQIASPEEIILSKIIFNFLLVVFLCVITLPLYSLFLGNLADDLLMLFLVAILASGAFSSIMTLVSAIASKSDQGPGLTAILTFPVILPLLMVTLKASKNAMDGIDTSQYTNLLVVMLAFNVVSVALSYILFPYLWRD